MQLESELKPKAYLSAMKENMEGHFVLGKERFTGFFLGSAFSVTYHSGYEWNRRITNEKNSAVGFVKKTEGGCLVKFVRFKGLLAPTQFLSTFYWMALLFWIACSVEGLTGGKTLAMGALISFVYTLVVAVVSGITDSLTAAGQEGARILMSLLLDPVDPFSYTHNRNRLD